MFKLVKDRIQQIENDRRKMSEIHHERFTKTKNKIEYHQINKSKKPSELEQKVRKELSRHF